MEENKQKETGESKNNKVAINFYVVFRVLLYLIGVVSILMAWKWYNSDLDIYSSGDPFKFHEKTYVGGDAYNYIISAARSSAIMMKSLIWMAFGCSMILVGVLCSIKEKLCK